MGTPFTWREKPRWPPRRKPAPGDVAEGTSPGRNFERSCFIVPPASGSDGGWFSCRRRIPALPITSVIQQRRTRFHPVRWLLPLRPAPGQGRDFVLGRAEGAVRPGSSHSYVATASQRISSAKLPVEMKPLGFVVGGRWPICRNSF